MADGLYVGMSAAVARAAQLDSIADNLANAETPGFKATRPAFRSFLPPGPSDKVLAGVVSTGVDMRPGPTNTTDNPLDVMPDGDSYFGVRLSNGQLAYTRNGHLERGPNGELLASGLPVLGTSGEPVSVPPGADPRIESNGNVVVGRNTVVDTLALFQAQGLMDKIAPSLLQPSTGSSMSPAADSTVRVGELEMGNVSALDSTVQMINAQRQYDMAMQAIQTYRKMDDRATQVGLVK
ncbi:MAG TPA: flagellar hook basal-body protein [Polyangia bacterium]|nr:flagellar hook basal-body protein [Polyangia bacterium]